mgnify:CR=1 FL=1
MSDRGKAVVPAEYVGVRADRAVANLSGLSRATVRRLMEEGAVTRRGKTVDRATRLEEGDLIEYPIPVDRQPLIPEEIPFGVAFVSAEVIVVDKPAGLVVHPGAGHATGTLANGLIQRFPELRELGEEHRWGLVHRLDRDTSGLLLVARTAARHAFLQTELKARRIGRTYVTVVQGTLEAATGTIDAPIGRDPGRPTRMAVRHDGRPARTHYRRLAEWPDCSLVEVVLETGRTHQIRVHMASIGNGVVGDPTYGPHKVSRADPGRIWLHARRLEFPLGDGSDQVVESAIPDDLRASLEALGQPSAGSIEG